MCGEPLREVNKPMPQTQSGSHARVTRLDALIALFVRFLGGRTNARACDTGIDGDDFERFQEGGLRNVGDMVARHKKRNRAIA